MPVGAESRLPASEVPQLVYIDNEGISDPRWNLAIEEYALQFLDPQYTYVLFYVNEPSIIIGRNQNAFAEINREYVKERGIHVVRRRSGGGAVYHDAGNLNFSFITNYSPERLNNFQFFTGPVVRVLQELGANAELQGRNDVVVDGRKVSGNAQYAKPRRMFSHGTLLFNTDLREVSLALNVKPRKFLSKGRGSVRARVANIAEFVEKEMDVPTFRHRLLQGLFPGSSTPPTYRLSAHDWAGVQKIIDERYGRWDWNFGESPAFDLHHTRRFAGGELDAWLDIRNGRIAGARLFGDMLATKALGPLEQRLVGVQYDREALLHALGPAEQGDDIAGLSRIDLLDLLLTTDEGE